MADKEEQKFEMQKVFLKDVSFEAPCSPEIFREKWSPKTEIHLASNSEKLADNIYLITLDITVTATQENDNDDKQVAFLVELKQCGIFSLMGFDDTQLNQILGSYCPHSLFPYAREAISDFVSKGGFPPMLLSPVNFDALYAQQQIARKKAQQEGEQTQH
ncbi:MAG: protein-export chaperone SecB [Gammaproteobacteria bacterium TMED119]|nr:MAG: protein-export chaperone SecB [Gammaproteobacteria bacterium TMED119]|tara:strand:- start:564 stop:1043 length:480 start_codon:yes stop_codon:yes gene_type:complete